MNLRERIAFSIAAMEPSIQGAAYQQGFFDAKAEALRRAESVTLDDAQPTQEPTLPLGTIRWRQYGDGSQWVVVKPDHSEYHDLFVPFAEEVFTADGGWRSCNPADDYPF